MNRRVEKINSEMRNAISVVINSEMSNPVISGIISVTRVETTSDLSFAKVYIAIFDTDAEHKQKVFSALVKAKGFIREKLKSKIDLRAMPNLQMVLDDSQENSHRINELLSQINKGNKGK